MLYEQNDSLERLRQKLEKDRQDREIEYLKQQLEDILGKDGRITIQFPEAVYSFRETILFK